MQLHRQHTMPGDGERWHDLHDITSLPPIDPPTPQEPDPPRPTPQRKPDLPDDRIFTHGWTVAFVALFLLLGLLNIIPLLAGASGGPALVAVISIGSLLTFLGPFIAGACWLGTQRRS